jgi:hypothetical protein
MCPKKILGHVPSPVTFFTDSSKALKFTSTKTIFGTFRFQWLRAVLSSSNVYDSFHKQNSQKR